MSCYERMESRGRGGSRAVIMRGRGGCRASVIMGGWNSEGARIMRGGPQSKAIMECSRIHRGLENSHEG